jgi:cellulose synthase/poly-beta-1,6-N-acetylglucosamine synthase-like glycosyltransferase
MTTVLQQILIFSGLCLVLSSAALFAAGARLRKTQRLTSSLWIAAISSAAWALQSRFLGADLSFPATMATALAAGALITVWFRSWNAAGHAAFTAIVGAVTAFLVYAVHALLEARLGPASLVFASCIFLLQLGTLVLLVANMYEIVDVVCRVHWARQHGPKRVVGYTPKVSIHVPIHAEPPDLVIETLDALARLDYADYEVLIIDNNTADESLWRPVEEHCARLGNHFRFFHLLPWPGYKSGALNYALSQTAPAAEIVAVVDADYVVESDFLADLTGHFADERVAFVQTPQDYRDHSDRGRYGRALYLAYLYFFEVSMASRNEHNGIIYAGTMGLIRRSALDALGGWDEWCVTEDAEISLRLLSAGYESVYVPKTYGRGIMPLDYSGLKKQRFRWAFGGMQILRKHAGLLLNPCTAGRLSWSQRLAYINGGLQWLNDPMALAFTALLVLGSAALLTGKSLETQPLAGAAILMPPVFILFAVMRFIWAFRLRARCSMSEAVDALVILLGLTWVVAFACIRGLFSRQGVFLRTPKSADEPRLRDALRIVLWESILGFGCLALAAALGAAHGARAVSVWAPVVLMLLWQAAVYLSTIRSSLWNFAERASRPRSWRTVFCAALRLCWGSVITQSRAALALVAVLAGVAAFVFVEKQPARMPEPIRSSKPEPQFAVSPSMLTVRASSSSSTAGPIAPSQSDRR